VNGGVPNKAVVKSEPVSPAGLGLVMGRRIKFAKFINTTTSSGCIWGEPLATEDHSAGVKYKPPQQATRQQDFTGTKLIHILAANHRMHCDPKSSPTSFANKVESGMIQISEKPETRHGKNQRAQ
jgi:hypothetical protein